MTAIQLMTIAGFVFLAFAAIFAFIGYLEIKRKHEDVGRIFLYAALICGIFLFLIILFLSSDSRPINMLIKANSFF